MLIFSVISPFLLGIPSAVHHIFCPGVNLDVADINSSKHQQESYSPCTVLILERENASHHAASLAQILATELRTEKIFGEIEKKWCCREIEKKWCCRDITTFRAVVFSGQLLELTGGLPTWAGLLFAVWEHQHDIFLCWDVSFSFSGLIWHFFVVVFSFGCCMLCVCVCVCVCVRLCVYVLCVCVLK